MAEPKKTSEKAKRSSKPSAADKPKDEVIEGSAIEKPAMAESTPPVNESAKPQNQSSTSQDRRRSTMLVSQSLAVMMAGVAVVVALIALAVSVVTYQQTADDTPSGKPAQTATINDVDQANLDKLGQRLDSLAALIAQNAGHYESLQQELANAASSGPSETPDMTSLDDLIIRLEALETAGANRIAAPAVTDEPAMQGGFDKRQAGLLAAAGLLAENLAGRNLEIWVSVLDDLQWPGVDAADRDIIRGAARMPADSRADLLSLGRMQLAPMVQALNKADDGSGLFEQARARLANLIQLRRTGGGSDQPETLLASFESALDQADFDAAFAAATIWSSAGLDGLESWLSAAHRRHDLDQAVNRLVAILVQHAAGQS